MLSAPSEDFVSGLPGAYLSRLLTCVFLLLMTYKCVECLVPFCCSQGVVGGGGFWADRCCGRYAGRQP